MKYLFLVCLFAFGGKLPGQAQPDSLSSSPRYPTVWSLWGQGGWVYAHTTDVRNTAGARPWGVHLEVGRQRTDFDAWQRFGCLPRTGLSLSYYDFGNAVLGRGGTAAYYVEPHFPLGARWSAAVRGSAGLSLLSNPYHPVRNPDNLSYSTTLNAYISLGFSARWHVAPRWWVGLAGSFQHVSNGGFRRPNKGINWPTLGLGLDYTLTPWRLVRPATTERHDDWRRSPPRFDAQVFGGLRNTAAGETRQYAVMGAGGTYSRRVSRLSGLTAGVEAIFDNALRAQLQRDTLAHSSLRVGLLVGHEFLLGKVIFSQQLGAYAFSPSPYFPRLYQRWGLLYRTGKRYSAGVSLLAHGQVANFWDIRLVRHW